jgi:hypothetical protein
MMKRKTTVYLEDSLLRALKVAAARSGQHEYQVVEQALRGFLGMELLDKIGSRNRQLGSVLTRGATTSSPLRAPTSLTS